MIVLKTNFFKMLPEVRKVIKVHIGDKVIIDKVSNASLNLYMKAKQLGYSYIKCPCNAKHNMTFDIISQFGKGYLLKNNVGLKTVAYNSDLRKV